MKKIKLVVELEYDDKIMHGEEQCMKDWFFNDILLGKTGLLLLHSNEIADCVGAIEGLEILAPDSIS